MESQRQQKFGKLIQKELADIFQKEGYGMFNGNMITITRVRMTPDLLIARVFLSVFGNDKKQETLELLKAKSSEIRFKLGQLIRKDVRAIPDLEIFLDDSLDYADKIDKLFDDIKKEEDQ